MNENTLLKMKQMKFYGMHEAFTSAIETDKMDDFTLDQFTASLIDAEWDDRQNRKIIRTIKNARFKYRAFIENIDYSTERNLDQNKIQRLASLDFIEKSENILITGSTGVGKSYLASAIGYQACIEGYRVMYENATKLFAKLKMAKADASYLKLLAKIERQHLIIIDDFGLQPLDQQNRMSMLEIIEDRIDKGSVIINSQIPVNKWYDIIGEKTVADAVLDRLVHQAHRIEIKGESMRRKKTKINNNKIDKFVV